MAKLKSIIELFKKNKIKWKVIKLYTQLVRPFRPSEETEQTTSLNYCFKPHLQN